MKQYKFGLALSGGGIAGSAHVGVLQALNDIGLKPDIVSGVSAGALVCAMYADGMSFDDMLNFFEESSFYKGVHLNMPKNGGLASVRGYKKYLSDSIKARDFSELKLPVIINATDLASGHIKYFTSGSIIDAVVASASVPVLFNPYKIGDSFYVDGGILCNLPSEVLRDKCDFVMGVHVNPIWPMPEDTKYNLKTVAERIFHLAVNGNTFRAKSFCDLVVDLHRDREVGMFSSSMSGYLMEDGYNTAMGIFKDFDFSKFGLTTKKF